VIRPSFPQFILQSQLRKRPQMIKFLLLRVTTDNVKWFLLTLVNTETLEPWPSRYDWVSFTWYHVCSYPFVYLCWKFISFVYCWEFYIRIFSLRIFLRSRCGHRHIVVKTGSRFHLGRLPLNSVFIIFRRKITIRCLFWYGVHRGRIHVWSSSMINAFVEVFLIS